MARDMQRNEIRYGLHLYERRDEAFALEIYGQRQGLADINIKY